MHELTQRHIPLLTQQTHVLAGNVDLELERQLKFAQASRFVLISNAVIFEAKLTPMEKVKEAL